MVEKLTLVQKERVKRLEPALKKAAVVGDLKLVKSIIIDLQNIYLSTGNEAKLLMAKNRWYEAEMEFGSLDTAELGLIGVKTKANKNTRVYLEAITLLAICYLRDSKLNKAEPLMREVLTNDNVIKSEERRQEFRRLVIERFDEEATLHAIKAENIRDALDGIEDEVNALSEDYSEKELFSNLGRQVPVSAKNILVQVDAFSKKQLPSAERLRLSAPVQSQDNEKVGKTVFSSVKRVIYKSICDKESDVYKSWYNNTASTLKTFVTVAVTEAFLKLSISIKALIVSVIAIIMKLGIGIYCEHFKPVDVMEIR